MIEIIVVILSLLLGGASWLFKHEREKRTEIEKNLSQKKYETYFVLVDALFDVFQSEVGRKKITTTKLVKELQRFNKEVIFYGSDKVLDAFQNYLIISRTDTEFDIQLDAIAKVIIEIRRDMGYPNTTFNERDFAIQMINDYEQCTAPGGMLELFNKKYLNENKNSYAEK